MNEDFEENAGPSAPRDEENFATGSRSPGVSVNGSAARYVNGHSRSRRKTFDFWTVADIFARRWHWLVVGGILAAGGFFVLAWTHIRPRFIAPAELLRYETPGTSDFLKTTPLTQETFAELITTPELLRRAGAKAQPPLSGDELNKRLKVDPQVESDFVKVYLSASTPEEAVQLANLYANEVTRYTSELQATQAAQVADTYLKEEVQHMDNDIAEIKAQFSGVPEAAQASNKLAQVGNNLSTLTQKPALSPESTFLISKLNEQLASTKVELSALLVKYTPEHPAVKEKVAAVTAIQNELNETMGNTNGSAPSAVIQANGSVIQPNVEVINANLNALEQKRVELESLEHQAKIYAQNPPGIVRVSAPADLNTTRTAHRRLKIGAVTIFGGALGMGTSLLLIFLVEVTDRRLRTADDVRRVTKLPVLTTLGDLEDMKEVDRTQWAFRTWTLLQGRLSRSQNHGLVCGVTSSGEGEGRSTWINMLAEAASLAGFRVLTIATRPSHSAIELPDEFSEETLDNHSEINGHSKMNGHPDKHGHSGKEGHSETTHNNGALTSSVLTSPSQVTEKLTDPNSRPVVHIPLPGWVWNLERRKQWRDALRQWRQIDNLVIFVELPPASVPEAVLLGANLPNLVWLAASGKADASETRVQLETLRNARCNLVGAVLNRESSRPIKSYFPRWLSCVAILALLNIGMLAHAQTAPTENATPAPPPEANRQPHGLDTNMTLLTEPPPGASAPAAEETHYSFSVVSPSQRAEWERNLTLGPGDILSFSMYGEPTLSRTEIPIGPDGRVSFLEAHDVLASGLTVDGLRHKMDDALSKYRRSPHTIIIPVSYGSKKYYVLGKVVQRGVYILDRPTTVLEALARAKGIESGQVDYDVVDVADLQHAFLMRHNKRMHIDFEKLFESGDLSQNVQIEPGDYLYFPSADVQQVFVLGEVSLPGPVTYRPNLSAIAAISARGGFSEAAFKSHIFVVRGSLNNPKTVIAGMGMTDETMHDFKLQPNDIIYVTWRPFHREEELLDLAAQAFVQSAVNGVVGAKVLSP